MNSEPIVAFMPTLRPPVTMTPDQREEALKDKKLWEKIENTWRGNGIDFIVKSVLAGRSNEWIYAQIEWPHQPCPGHKQSCFRAFDYVRAVNWEAVP